VRRSGDGGQNSINDEALRANRSYLSVFDLAIFCAMDITNPRSPSSMRLSKPRDLVRPGDLIALPPRSASKFMFC